MRVTKRKDGEVTDPNAPVDADNDGIDDSVDSEVLIIPIELGPVPDCYLCNDTGAVAKRTHEDDNGLTVIDEYKNCSCGKAAKDREAAKIIKNE